MTQAHEIQQEEFKFLQTYIKEACGLVVPDNKQYLITSRLTPVIEKHGLDSYKRLCAELRFKNTSIQEDVLTELTTHETYFFRDKHPFEAFRTDILSWLEERIVERRKRSVIRKGSKASIWCAAASTGQEPYSLAMLVKQHMIMSSIEDGDVSILATDVSPQVLSKAVSGLYNKMEVGRGLDEAFGSTFKNSYFRPVGNDYEVVGDVKKMIDFKCYNLTDSLTNLGGFDVIFCRNVLIYFDGETKNKIIAQFHHMLSEDGFLVLGASENLGESSHLFRAQSRGATVLYRKT